MQRSPVDNNDRAFLLTNKNRCYRMVPGISCAWDADDRDSKADGEAAKQNEKIARCVMKFLVIVIGIKFVTEQIRKYVQKEEKLSP